jgi:hypothetical protein
MIKMDKNGVPVAEMPQRWDLAIDCDGDMVPMEEGDWVKAEDMQTLVALFNTLAQMASVMMPKGRI